MGRECGYEQGRDDRQLQERSRLERAVAWCNWAEAVRYLRPGDERLCALSDWDVKALNEHLEIEGLEIRWISPVHDGIGWRVVLLCIEEDTQEYAMEWPEEPTVGDEVIR